MQALIGPEAAPWFRFDQTIGSQHFYRAFAGTHGLVNQPVSTIIHILNTHGGQSLKDRSFFRYY